MAEKVKACTACGEEKPLSSFDTRAKGGYRYLLGPCRDCERDRKNTRNRKLLVRTTLLGSLATARR